VTKKAPKPKTLEQVLKKGEPLSYADIKRLTGLTKKTFNVKLHELKSNGVPIKAYVDQNDYTTYFYMDKSIGTRYSTPELHYKDGNYKAILTGDWHIGSKYFAENFWLSMFDTAQDEGITDMFMTGDLIDGVEVFTGQHNEINIHSKMEQLDYLIDLYPVVEGMKLYYITGNHDLKKLTQSFDPGIIFNQKIPNSVYIGQMSGDVQISNGLEFRLIHLRGSAYSRFYNIQKYLRQLPPTDMPNVLLRGHNHQVGYAKIQGVHSVETGAFQRPESNFVKSLGLTGKPSFVICEYDIINHKLDRFKIEIVSE